MTHDFITPANHIRFLSKTLCGPIKSEIQNASVAYLEPHGGGPLEPHTHSHDHLFIVMRGEARLLLDGREQVIKKDEALLVKGSIPHSVWNNVEFMTVMIGLNLQPSQQEPPVQ